MSIEGDVRTLQPLEIVEMFVYDDTAIGGSQVIRWHAGTQPAYQQPIIWQGATYSAFPIQATGFAVTASGSLPRPSLKAANIGGSLGAYIRSMKDALGAKVTRKRTIGKYLDAVNFPAGNPTADPNAHFPDEVFYVARKASENAMFIEIELSVSYDISGVRLPRRQVVAGTCMWIYRGPDCAYSGPPVQDINGNPTSDPNKDQCRKTLTACKARFGATGVLNTSAFPASMLASAG